MGDSLPRVVFVLGPPGAGKGTQCKLIQEKYGFQHLSAGELLRAERQMKESPLAEKIDTHFRRGLMAPVEITVGLLHKAMQNSKCSNFLIDGFPPNEDNLSGWNRIMEGKAHVEFMLVLECPIEKLAHTIDGSAPPEKVFGDVCQLFDTLTASSDASVSTKYNTK